MHAWVHPAPQAVSWLSYGLAWGQEMLQQRLPTRTSCLGSNNITAYEFSSHLDSRGIICGGGSCCGGWSPEKGTPPLHGVTKNFGPKPLADSGLRLLRLGARAQGLESWEQASCLAQTELLHAW